jgi:hypothetical protein
MQIMVAEQGSGRRAELPDESQYAQAIGAAVDQVTDEPQFIVAAVKRKLVDQFPEFGAAALDIADGEYGHVA